MRESLSAQAVLSVSEFKQNTNQTLERLETSGPHILTQNGKSAAVMMTAQDYDRLMLKLMTLQHAVNGLIDELDNGTIPHEEVVQALNRRFEKRA